MALITRKDLASSQRIWEGAIVNLRVDTVRLQDGKEITREVVEHSGGVVIACQPEPEKIILIRQYRYVVDEVLYELPAGRLELGEDPLAAAKRELVEETGYKANNWHETVRMFSAPGFCNELLYLYKASNVEFVGNAPDEDEEIEVVVLSLDAAWQLALDGRVRDAKTIAGIALLREQQK